MTRVLLAGGGLANCLIAWRLAALRPELDLVLVEEGPALGGNHTWSVHGGDLDPEDFAWLRPLVAHAWPAQEVRFPAYQRRLATPYYSITSERLHAALAGALGSRVRLGARVVELGADGARLASGEEISADLVLDGRGAAPMPGFELRWQKFLGLELELARDHGLEVPLLMDATVAQRDGYRFLYVLPLGPRRLLVEDTCYSDTPALAVRDLRRRVRDYAAARGWEVVRECREETGVLPIVLDGDPQRCWAEAGVAVPRTGMRALLFHHTTGYSLPDAARLASALAAVPRLASAPVAAWIRDLSLARWREQGFFRLLNRLMFEAARPEQRYRTLEHFYRLGEPLIGRFYAGRLGRLDALRILSGRPPVPVGRALACLARGAGWRTTGAATAPGGNA